MFKRHLPLFVLTTLVCMLAGCSGGRTPRTTAQLFLENLAQGKLAEAKKYATEQTSQFLDFASSMGTIPTEPDYKFLFVSEKIDGETAVVRFKDKEGSEDDIDLIRVDGEWKVHIKKE